MSVGVRNEPQHSRLPMVGVGVPSSPQPTVLLVEIGDDMTAFGSAGCLAKWAGICPGNDQSVGKRRNAKTPKGNRYVRALLCEIAWSAARTASQFKSRYQGLVIRRGA